MKSCNHILPSCIADEISDELTTDKDHQQATETGCSAPSQNKPDEGEKEYNPEAYGDAATAQPEGSQDEEREIGAARALSALGMQQKPSDLAEESLSQESNAGHGQPEGGDETYSDGAGEKQEGHKQEATGISQGIAVEKNGNDKPDEDQRQCDDDQDVAVSTEQTENKNENDFKVFTRSNH